MVLRPRVPAGPRRNAAHPPPSPARPRPPDLAGGGFRRGGRLASWAGSGGSWRRQRRGWRAPARARRGSCCGRSATPEASEGARAQPVVPGPLPCCRGLWRRRGAPAAPAGGAGGPVQPSGDSCDNEHGLERICAYCFQFLVPDSYRVRLRPKMKVTPQIEKILKREAKNHKLNMKQTKLLKKYRESRSVLLVTCNSCNKTTRHYGKSRDFLATKTHGSGTPSIKSSLRTPDVKIQSANKVTPVSCSRLGSKGNSPSSLPRTRLSGQATTSSASKTPRNSKFHFSKLKRMLNLEEKEKSQKADLKTFLTLL
ncbi:UPF0711 protein C18orf21 homolog isoform X1 [Calonectris borealis]|uniref:UPF0711 protein C18orf21 homolog isoform X1 n=1 Tax=Calonectris borealis TaxID=1323832 RepID=UPI003F4B7135